MQRYRDISMEHRGGEGEGKQAKVDTDGRVVRGVVSRHQERRATYTYYNFPKRKNPHLRTELGGVWTLLQ